MIHEKLILLTPAQVAERYGGNISVRTLANWRSKGKRPAYMKNGGKVMYDERSLAMWEERRMMLVRR